MSDNLHPIIAGILASEREKALYAYRRSGTRGARAASHSSIHL